MSDWTVLSCFLKCPRCINTNKMHLKHVHLLADVPLSLYNNRWIMAMLPAGMVYNNKTESSCFWAQNHYPVNCIQLCEPLLAKHTTNWRRGRFVCPSHWLDDSMTFLILFYYYYYYFHKSAAGFAWVEIDTKTVISHPFPFSQPHRLQCSSQRTLHTLGNFQKLPP